MYKFHQNIILFLICLLVAMPFAGGCSPTEHNHDRNAQKSDAASSHADVVPTEYLVPDFMKTLRSQIIGHHLEPSVRRNFPPEAAETEEARKLIIWLLSEKNFKELKDNGRQDEELKRIRIRLCGYENGENQDIPYFVVFTNGHVGSSVRVLVGYPAERRFETVRYFAADEEVVQRINKLFEVVKSANNGVTTVNKAE